MNRNAATPDQSERAQGPVEEFAVSFKSASTAIGLALFMTGGSVFGVMAQDAAVPDTQQPPAGQQAPADQAAPEKPKCVTSNTAWKESGKAATFEIELQNTCDVRLKCTVDAFVIGARGQAQGHGTLILAPAPKGQTTHKSYVMKVKGTGGMANVSHSCKSV